MEKKTTKRKFRYGLTNYVPKMLNTFYKYVTHVQIFSFNFWIKRILFHIMFVTELQLSKYGRLIFLLVDGCNIDIRNSKVFNSFAHYIAMR